MRIRNTEPTNPQPYVVRRTDGVDAAVSEFSYVERIFWNACVEIISENPWPREGARAYKIPGLPYRTFIFEIAADHSTGSGQPFYLLMADCLPKHRPVFLINEQDHEVTILYLRDNPHF